jgi:DHA2 family multidrug resistance protein-like MFS transporter
VGADAAAAATDTLGGAVGVASQLPVDTAAVVLGVARDAFVTGMQITTGIAAGIAIGLSILAVVALRTATTGGDGPESDGEPAEPSSARPPEQVAHVDPTEVATARA